MINEDKVPFNLVNITVTAMLLIYIVSGFYSIKEDIISPFIIISVVVFFLICFFVIFFCIRKINNETATNTHMELIRIVPIFGLIYKNSSAYRRMEKKLISSEAIQGCKNALNNMEINYSTDDWNAFSEWFPKIDHKWNVDIRFPLILRVLCEKRKHETENFREESMMKLLNIIKTKAYKEMDLADFLRLRLLDETDSYTHKEDELTNKALEKEFFKRTSRFNELLNNLTQSTVSVTFEEMCKN